jgi:hypothetical protein
MSWSSPRPRAPLIGAASEVRHSLRISGASSVAPRVATTLLGNLVHGHLVHGHLVSVGVRRWAVTGLGGNAGPGGGLGSVPGTCRMTLAEEPVGAARLLGSGAQTRSPAVGLVDPRARRR